jgi:hypothetical protein
VIHREHRRPDGSGIVGIGRYRCLHFSPVWILKKIMHREIHPIHHRLSW